MSKLTVLGVTQARSEVQRTQMEKEEQKRKICWRLPAEIDTLSKYYIMLDSLLPMFTQA